ncbi:unnamed protein product (macronuclear) [Paramecium tetraurelia]|uniref:Uncharacterized protein n=1 Tax=Paramecium tetraurelia TaxID=5888 RepID=A0BMI2_PARTE|nr:uncharacterized protein GSPATT00030385001 [Paramecium tetraurelia]CAK59749.1 unnamed protein product [Paramecium tetraurelia]|eukprot:XP_001427147.1 hypothetical protein (macronuclear) [Paramecium tetraurelia strain d4-2]
MCLWGDNFELNLRRVSFSINLNNVWSVAIEIVFLFCNRSYPTESTEFLECKANNRMYAQVLATTRESKESALLSKLVTLREQQMEIISTIGSPRATVKTSRGVSDHVGAISPRSFGRRLDEKLPMKELGEIANYFNTLRAEQAKTLSRNYVNEMVRLQQCIEKKLKR